LYIAIYFCSFFFEDDVPLSIACSEHRAKLAAGREAAQSRLDRDRASYHLWKLKTMRASTTVTPRVKVADRRHKHVIANRKEKDKISKK